MNEGSDTDLVTPDAPDVGILPPPTRQYSDRWELLTPGKRIGSGGQGSICVVRPRGGDPNVRAVLKRLHKPKDPDRRGRMYRELAAYRTLQHPGIPGLFDSNAECFNDLSYELYLVTAFIEGPTLEQRVLQQGCLSPAEVLKFATALLSTLEYFHSRRQIHRDLKPDNVIIRGDNCQDPVVVDFGLSFNEADAPVFETEIGQEIGNRFLRLPEFGIGSLDKRDRRSDLSMTAGLILFALSGQVPVALRDQHDRFPHQRPHIRERLDAIENVDLSLMLFFFDRSFQQEPDARWQTAKEMQDILDRVFRPNIVSSDSEHDLIARLRERPDAASDAHIAIQRMALRSMKSAIMQAVRELASELGSAVDWLQTGPGEVPPHQEAVTMGLLVKGRWEVRVDFFLEFQGSEVIVTARSRELTAPSLLRLAEAVPDEKLRLFARHCLVLAANRAQPDLAALTSR